MAFRSRDAVRYISKTRQSDAATPVTTGANFLRAASQNLVPQIPQMEKRTDAGRAGNIFPSQPPCNLYWLPGDNLNYQADADFDLGGRLSLRGVGGSITGPTTIVSSLAFRYVASMISGASGSNALPYFTVLDDIPGSGADHLFAGCQVGSMTMSQDGANPVQLSFTFTNTGKHRSPHAVSSLPSLAAFSCLKTLSIVEYTDSGGLVDLAAGCDLKAFTITLNNNQNPTDDRCSGDPHQDYGDYTAEGGDSDHAYLTKIERGDPTLTATVTVELDATMAQQLQAAENEPLTNVTFGALGADLDPGGTPDTTFEFLKWIIPTATFTAVVVGDNNGRAVMTLTFQPYTSGTSVLTVQVQNGQSTGVQ